MSGILLPRGGRRALPARGKTSKRGVDAVCNLCLAGNARTIFKLYIGLCAFGRRAGIIHAFRSFDKCEGKWCSGGLPSSRFVLAGFKAVSPFFLESWPSFSCLVRSTLFFYRNEQNRLGRYAGGEFHTSAFARLG